MAWPTTPVVTTGMDADTDPLPRSDILDLTTKFNQLIAMKDVAGGVVGLTSDNRIIVTTPASQSGYSTAALEARSNVGNVAVGLHAPGVSAVALVHVRGTNMVQVLNSDGTLGRMQGGTVSVSSDYITVGEADGRFINVGEGAGGVLNGTYPSPGLAAGTVGQGNIKTSAAQVGRQADAGGGQYSQYGTGAGAWGFYPRTYADMQGAGGLIGFMQMGWAVFGTSISSAGLPSGWPYNAGGSGYWDTIITIGAFNASNVGAGVQYYNQLFITASPPFNLGNGDISIFNFATIEKSSGKIMDVWSCPVPPWAYNGPTNIRPDYTDPDTGKKYVYQRPANLNADIRDKTKRAAAINALSNKPQLVEITMDMKNADMPLLPHPMISANPTKHEVVLLDPVGPITDKLALLQDAEENIPSLILNKYITIDNSVIAGAKTPPGVNAHSVKWSNVK